MAKNKKDTCPDCCIHTVAIKPENCIVIYDEKNRLQKNRDRNHSFELIINRIIQEWKIDRDVDKAINNNKK